MDDGKYVFSQVVGFLPKYEFSKCVERYRGDRYVKDFTCWTQFLAMLSGQLTRRESLRETVVGLAAQQASLYRLGFRSHVSLSTLAHANERRNWQIYRDFAAVLANEAQALYASSDDRVLPEFPGKVFVIDSTTIDLCLSVFWWAPFRESKAAVKLHTMIDLRGVIPTVVIISDGLMNDIKALRSMSFEAGAFYVMDRGYMSLAELLRIHRGPAFFLIRTKHNLAFETVGKAAKVTEEGVLSDLTIVLSVRKSRQTYPDKLRLISYFDKEQERTFQFLTNNFSISAGSVALLYKNRWKIELFFKWIKQNLKIKTFWGESENAVKTQIWIAVCAYLTVMIVRKRLNIDRSMNEILQIISTTAFNKQSLFQLLSKSGTADEEDVSAKQLKLFDF
jgi:hypothetical protein